MSLDLRPIRFSYDHQRGEHPATLDQLVKAWLACSDRSWRTPINPEGMPPVERDPDWWSVMAVEDLCDDHPQLGFAFVLAALALDPAAGQLSLLAAGPLENLLARHGEAIIEPIENEARNNPAFRKLLRGVWQNAMSDTIWGRVEAAQRDPGA